MPKRFVSSEYIYDRLNDSDDDVKKLIGPFEHKVKSTIRIGDIS